MRELRVFFAVVAMVTFTIRVFLTKTPKGIVWPNMPIIPDR